MFEAFRDFIRMLGPEDGGRPRRLGEADPRVAAAALLYHVGAADGAVGQAEFDRLKLSLAEEFGLDPREAGRIAAAGQEADLEAVDLYQFTSILKGALDERQRIRFVELLWGIVYADGVVHELEDNTIWRVADLLGVSTRDRMLTKHAAAARDGAAT